jgi:hypothetical protein
VGLLLPTAVVVTGSLLAGPVVGRVGLRQALVGALAVGVAGATLLGWTLTKDGAYAWLVPGLVAVSLGDGMVCTTMFIATAAGSRAAVFTIAAGIAATLLVTLALRAGAHPPQDAPRKAPAGRARPRPPVAGLRRPAPPPVLAAAKPAGCHPTDNRLDDATPPPTREPTTTTAQEPSRNASSKP